MRRGEERRGPNLLSLLPHHANLIVSRDPLPPVLTAGTASSSRTFGSRSEQPRVEREAIETASNGSSGWRS